MDVDTCCWLSSNGVLSGSRKAVISVQRDFKGPAGKRLASRHLRLISTASYIILHRGHGNFPSAVQKWGSLGTQKSSNFSYKRTLEDQLAENLRGSMCEWTGRAAAQDQACLGAPLASRLLWGHSAGGRNLGTPAGNPRRGGWVEG